MVLQITDILNSYENRNLDEIMPLGWGIFGWINRWIFIPVLWCFKWFITLRYCNYTVYYAGKDGNVAGNL